jgi:hypothetical protein
MADYDSAYTGTQADAGIAGGILYAANKLDAATKAIFYQDTAPTTWTIANTLDDKLLFITKGNAAGGETGGGVHSTGTWTQPNHTHTYTGVVNHVHTQTCDGRGGPVSSYGAYSADPAAYMYTGASAYTGNPVGGAASGTTANGATANTWRPAAYCAIIATKDAY